jgi:hypothetical protein
LIDQGFDLSSLADEFEQLGMEALDFEAMLSRAMDCQQTAVEVRRMVIAALEKGREDDL